MSPSELPAFPEKAQTFGSDGQPGEFQDPKGAEFFEAERRQRAMATIQDDDERMLMRIGYKQVRSNGL